MIWLTIGLVLFVGAHLVPMVPAVRKTLAGVLGEPGCKGVIALFALAGFVLIVFGYSRADFAPVYAPPAWGMTAAQWLMLAVFPLLVASYQPSNVKRITRHPMLWATVLWALAHTLANGDLASLALFGTFGVWALLAMGSANRRGAQLHHGSVPVVRDVINVVLGVVVYALVGYFHASVFGVASGGFPAS